MTEWLLRQPKKLRETYLNAGNEYSELIKLAKKFVDTEKICRQDGKVFHPATTYYFDVVQVILHLWGLYNTVIINKTEFIGVKNITLICGMWTIENKEFRQFERYEKIKKDADIEFQRFKDSKELEDVIKIFDKENICLKIKKMTVKEIIECLVKTDEPYLKRYI